MTTLITQLNPADLIIAKNIANGTLKLENFVDLYEKLFNHYSDEMPYGTQKARTGDPYNWITERLQRELPEKLTIPELQVLVGSYVSNKSSHLRVGQTYFNSLYEINPYLADKVRTTENDPFYNDKRLDGFFKEVCTPEAYEIAKTQLI